MEFKLLIINHNQFQLLKRLLNFAGIVMTCFFYGALEIKGVPIRVVIGA
jgi:hypothetical protein